MYTIKKFEHEGRHFEIRVTTDEDGWNLKVFVNGEPTKVSGDVSREIQSDANKYNIGDPRAIIADALEEYITNGAS